MIAAAHSTATWYVAVAVVVAAMGLRLWQYRRRRAQGGVEGERPERGKRS